MRVKIFPAEAKSQTLRRAYVGVSLSNRVATSSERLRDILLWTKSHSEEFAVVIGDYFHRHNLEDIDGLSESDALTKALVEGKNHARLVRHALDAIGAPSAEVQLASHLCTQPRFAARLLELEALYSARPDFRQPIDLGTDDFLRRFAPERIANEAARRHSRMYQLEELAMFHLLAEDDYSANVYPGAHLPVMKEVVAGNLPDILPAIAAVTLVELRFGSVS